VTRESEAGLGLSLYGKSETFREIKEETPKEPTKVHRPPPVPMRVIV